MSRTFHGRDIFAPVAAWLSRGLAPEEVGPPVGDPRRSERFPRLAASRSDRGVIVHLDRFGNALTQHRPPVYEESGGGRGSRISSSCPAAARSGASSAATPRRTPGRRWPFGSAGYLEVAVDRGSAGERLRLRRGDAVRVRLGAFAGGPERKGRG